MTMNATGLLAELALRGGFPIWAALALIALAVVAAGFVYFREAMSLARWQRLLFAGLRGATLVLVALLLCKPVLIEDVQEERTNPYAFALDDSESMEQKDPRLLMADQLRVAMAFDKIDPALGLKEPASMAELPAETPARRDVAKAAMTNPRINLVEKLREKGSFQPYLLGSRLRSISDRPGKPFLDEWAATDPRSALADGVRELLNRDANELPSSIILVTDGRDNASSISLEEAARLAGEAQVPIHVYGVGGSSQGYLQLKDVPVQETLFVEDLVKVPFRYSVQGFDEADLDLVVTLGGKEVARRTVRAKSGSDISEELSFSPSKGDATGGRQELVGSIALRNATQNLSDEVHKSVRVVDRKVKVLVIEKAPRWEFKYLQRTLMRDRRVEASFILIDADRRVAESGEPFLAAFPPTRRELFAFDLVILGDVDAKWMTDEQQKWLRDFVAEGGGLVMISGRNFAPASYVGTPLYDVLPVDVPVVDFPADSGKRPEEFKPRLTDAGKRSPMVMLADTPEETLTAWDELPGWYWNYPVTKLRPAATALLEHPRDKTPDNKPMPLMATQYYGKGLVLFLASEETWRWRFNPANDPDKYFPRFWGQVIYQIGLPRVQGNKAAQLALEQGEATLGKPGRVFARLFNAEFRPLTAERVTGRLERLDAPPGEERFRSVTLEAIPNQPGEYVASLANDQPGRFALRVEGGAESALLEFRVLMPPDHEQAKTPMNEEVLRKVAELSGGRFYREEDLLELPGQLAQRVVTTTHRQEILLWNWWMLVLVVMLLTIEWVARKFSNLS